MVLQFSLIDSILSCLYLTDLEGPSIKDRNRNSLSSSGQCSILKEPAPPRGHIWNCWKFLVPELISGDTAFLRIFF